MNLLTGTYDWIHVPAPKSCNGTGEGAYEENIGFEVLTRLRA